MITSVYLCYNPTLHHIFACHQRPSVYATPTPLFGTPWPFFLHLFLTFSFSPALIPCLRSLTFETSFSVCLFLTAGFNEFDVNHFQSRRSLRFAATVQ